MKRVASDLNFIDLSGLLIFLIHSLLTVIGLLLLKTSVNLFEKFNFDNLTQLLNFKFALGLTFYLSAFVVSLIILNRYSLGVSVSIMMSLSIVMSVLFGYIFLNEKISIQIIVGLSLLLAGILTVYYGKN